MPEEFYPVNLSKDEAFLVHCPMTQMHKKEG
jgi:hypothetical protein